MADGELKLELDAALSARLRAAADAAGRPAESLAAEMIAHALGEDWSVAVARLEEYDRTGEYLDGEASLRGFREALTQRFRTQG